VRNGEVVLTKKFQLNKLNYQAVSEIHGTNSDNYLNKEMMVNIVQRQNPQTGKVGPGIALSALGVPGEASDVGIE